MLLVDRRNPCEYQVRVRQPVHAWFHSSPDPVFRGTFVYSSLARTYRNACMMSMHMHARDVERMTEDDVAKRSAGGCKPESAV